MPTRRLAAIADEELGRLVGAASEKLGQPPQDIVRWFGREALPALAQAYPGFFTGHTETRSFVLTLNDIIHPEVRKLYPGADVPVFDFDEADDGDAPDGLRVAPQDVRLRRGPHRGRGCAFRRTSVDRSAPLHAAGRRPHCDLVLAFEPLAAA